ncbi:MAG: hypothetical protein U9N53_11850 [Bacteroidota bacterium]|nr:hypothetical protein [Bacteroidota bacterium]
MICEYQRDLREIVLADKAEEERLKERRCEDEKLRKSEDEKLRKKEEVRENNVKCQMLKRLKNRKVEGLPCLPHEILYIS